MAGGSQQPRPWGSSTDHGKEGGPRPAMGKTVEVDRPWGRRGRSTGHGGSRQPVDDGEEGGTDGGGRPAMGKKGRPWGSSAAGEEGTPRARAAARHPRSRRSPCRSRRRRGEGALWRGGWCVRGEGLRRGKGEGLLRGGGFRRGAQPLPHEASVGFCFCFAWGRRRFVSGEYGGGGLGIVGWVEQADGKSRGIGARFCLRMSRPSKQQN